MTPAEQAQLADNWATILQSEWAGLAADRELHDTMHRAAGQLAQQAALLHAGPSAGPAPAGAFPAAAGASYDPCRLAGADAPPGSAAAGAALGAAGASVPANGADGIAGAGGVAPSLG